MANQSTAPPANSKAEFHLPGNGEGGNGFSGSQPMREDQIVNAVNFLSHPRVKGSPVAQRRSFLEQKGLTKDEIDEAFRRVPDPSPNTITSPSPNPNQGLDPPVTSPVKPQIFLFNLRIALIATGVLASTGAGATILCKKSLIPRLKSWIKKVVEDEENELNIKKCQNAKLTSNQEVIEAIKMASSAADVATKATQELQNAKIQDKKNMEVMMDSIDSKIEEMKSIGKSIKMIHFSNEVFSKEVDKSWTGAIKSNSSFIPSKQIIPTVKPQSKEEPIMAPHPQSYMEIIEMIQRGEKPPNIKDINDMPPDPNQPIPKPRMSPKPKPWEANVPHQRNPTDGKNENPNLQYSAEIVTPGMNNEFDVSTNEVLYEV